MPWRKLKDLYVHSMITNQQFSLLVRVRAPKVLLITGKSPSSSSCNTSHNLFAPVIQWTADVTEHAHVTEIKQPARSGNNQDYYSQIARHLDHREKCSQFDLTTHLVSIEEGGSLEEDQEDQEDRELEHEPDLEALHIFPTRKIINYFESAKTLASGVVPDAACPYRILASSTTAFRLAVKPLLRVSTDEAADMYGLPDLWSAITGYLSRADCLVEITNLPTEKMQVWFKVRVQLPNYHDPQLLEPPQSLLASPPLARVPIGRYDFAIISQSDESDWPSNGLRGVLCMRQDILIILFTTFQGTK